MMVCKASKVVLVHKNPTSKENCYSIQLSVPSTTASRKKNQLYFLNISFATHIIMWDMVGWVLSFFVNLVGGFNYNIYLTTIIWLPFFKQEKHTQRKRALLIFSVLVWLSAKSRIKSLFKKRTFHQNQADGIQS